MRPEAHSLDVANDGFDLFRPRRGLHHNEHGGFSLDKLIGSPSRGIGPRRTALCDPSV